MPWSRSSIAGVWMPAGGSGAFGASMSDGRSGVEEVAGAGTAAAGEAAAATAAAATSGAPDAGVSGSGGDDKADDAADDAAGLMALICANAMLCTAAARGVAMVR